MTYPSIDNHIHESLLSFHSFRALYPLSPACTSDSDQLLFKMELSLCVNLNSPYKGKTCSGGVWVRGCGVWFLCLQVRTVSFNIVILHPFYLVNNQLYNVPIIEPIFGGSAPIIRPLSSRYLETRSQLFTQ